MAPPLVDSSIPILDTENECLWRDGVRIGLTAKCFALLRCLVERRPNLVTKRQVLQSVWTNARVEEGQVKQFVAELRHILGDDPKNPRYIESVRGRGYRFVGAIAVQSEEQPVTGQKESAAQVNGLELMGLIGMDEHFRKLDRCLEKALAGRANLVFVEGGVGTGKTALVSRFIRHVEGRGDVLILRAGCVREEIPVATFTPFIDAIKRGRLRQGETAAWLALQRHAPGWADLVAKGGETGGMTETSRWTRPDAMTVMHEEIVNWLEAVSRETAVLIWIDDLHRADDASIELLRRLASQPLLGRVLMLVGCVILEQLPQGRTRQGVVKLLTDGAEVSEVRLLPMGLAHITDWAVAMWRAANPQLAQGLMILSGGIPAMLARMLDVMTAEEYRDAQATALGPDASNDDHSMPGLPLSLQRWGHRFVSQLGTLERDLLAVLSSNQHVVDDTSLAIDAGKLTARQLEALQGLARDGRMIESWDSVEHGVRSYRFTCRFWWQLISSCVGSGSSGEHPPPTR